MFKECNIKGFATEKKYLNITYDSMYYFNLVIICDEKFNDSRKEVIKVNP